MSLFPPPTTGLFIAIVLVSTAPLLAANVSPSHPIAAVQGCIGLSCFAASPDLSSFSPQVLKRKRNLGTTCTLLPPSSDTIQSVRSAQNTRVRLSSSLFASIVDEGIETADVIYCGIEKIPFLRSAFGMYDDVTAEVWSAEPICADEELKNAEQLRGRIALVQRGSEDGGVSSFVDKAHRVEAAGAVGCIILNTEDSLVAPGDSAREGTDVRMPVVGIRSSDRARLPNGEEATLSFQPIAALTSEQRKHLRAVAMIKETKEELAEFLLEGQTSSEAILSGIDALLAEHELISVRFGLSASTAVSLSDLEDVIDVSTVLADNLRATVIQIKSNVIIMHRSNPLEPKIPLPAEGEGEGLLLTMLDGVDVRALDPITKGDLEPFPGHPHGL